MQRLRLYPDLWNPNLHLNGVRGFPPTPPQLKTKQECPELVNWEPPRILWVSCEHLFPGSGTFGGNKKGVLNLTELDQYMEFELSTARKQNKTKQKTGGRARHPVEKAYLSNQRNWRRHPFLRAAVTRNQDLRDPRAPLLSGSSSAGGRGRSAPTPGACARPGPASRMPGGPWLAAAALPSPPRVARGLSGVSASSQGVFFFWKNQSCGIEPPLSQLLCDVICKDVTSK